MGFFSTLKKKFKKFANRMKKIAPVILAGAAVFFTAGAALGVLGAGAAAGGWGGVAGAIGSTLGSGVLGTAATGAITQAGYGAAIGGIVSKATGGSFSDGARSGALTGAITGGVMGGLGYNTDPLKGSFKSGGPTQLTDPSGATFDPSSGTYSQPETQAGGLLDGSSAVVQQPTGFVDRYQGLIGNAVGGLGQGLMAQGMADDQRKADADRRRQIAANYEGSDMILPSANVTRGQGAMGYEWRWNPQTGRIERTERGVA